MKRDICSRVSFLQPLIPKGPRQRLHARVVDMRRRKLPDRQYLEQVIFPWILAQNPGRVLFVGCESFTSHYRHMFEKPGREYWTLDILPEMAVWGSRQRHVVGDILTADARFDHGYFDTVVFNGVFGFGVDTIPDMNASLLALHTILKPGGLMVLGWNTDASVDPSTLPAICPAFEPLTAGPLPARVTFPGSTHVYDFYLAAAH
jgi:SAM-dependent methyltransferase